MTLQVLDYARDRAQVFTGSSTGELAEVATIFRNTGNSASIALPAANSMSLLVENMGRINFGHSLTDHKGITQAVILGGHNISGTGITVDTLPLKPDQVQKLPFGASYDGAPGPRFYKASFQVDGTPADTYLSTRNTKTNANANANANAVGEWHKGYIWVNGHNLGRYWEDEGPQHALYVPSTFLHTGANEIIVLEVQPDAIDSDLVLHSTTVADFSANPPAPAPGAKCSATPEAGHVVQVLIVYSIYSRCIVISTISRPLHVQTCSVCVNDCDCFNWLPACRLRLVQEYCSALCV